MYRELIETLTVSVSDKREIQNVQSRHTQCDNKKRLHIFFIRLSSLSSRLGSLKILNISVWDHTFGLFPHFHFISFWKH